MSIRPLILKDGVYTIPRNSTDTSSLLAALGLNLVNNTSDLSKPVSTATQTALDLKANLVSPNITGTPTVPTATAGTNTTQAANCAFVSTAISNLVASSPAALDTLNELAAALGNDANFSTTITNSLANKVDLTTNQSIGGSKSFTGGLLLPSTTGTFIGTIWRNVDNLEYKDSSNVTKIILNSAGNLSNVSNKQTALNNLVGTQTANRVLRSDGTNVTLSSIALDTDVINVLSVNNGGTGSNTLNFVDLSNTQTITGTKTFSSVPRIQAVAPGFWLDETDHTVKGAYLVLDGGFFQVQRRATNFGGFEAILAQLNILTGEAKFNGTVASTSTTTGTLTVGGGMGVVGNVNIGGFTSLGDNVAIKVKKITGITASTQGAGISVLHNLTGDKILGFTLKINYIVNGGMPDGHKFYPGYEANAYHDSTHFVISNTTSNSASILSKGFTITVFYIE